MRKAIMISALALGVLALPLMAAAQKSLLESLGLKAGQSYASAKSQLAQKGWRVDANHRSEHNEDGPPPYGFKEVICGNGRDASCSARFLKADQEVMLTLRPMKTLVVDGAWDDK